jgi:hypothetical protein
MFETLPSACAGRIAIADAVTAFVPVRVPLTAMVEPAWMSESFAAPFSFR